MKPARVALRGDLLDFTGEPELGAVTSAVVRYRPDHWLLIEDGRIVAAQSEAPDEGWRRIDHGGRLILPGFIDSHVHSAQVDVIGSWGAQLLDWLEAHTFPAEKRFAEPEHARCRSAAFLDALLAHGTTSAVVFPTVHAGSVDALFEAGTQRGMRLITGKVLMDRHAPDTLLDDVAQAERECVDLIERWHGRHRCGFAVTPRFAPTSSEAQLAMAGRLLRAWPDLHLQTHLAENRAEVRWVHELFPAARSYLDVYQRHGLVGPRSLFAHAIWLDDEDRARLADLGAKVAFCPSSNLFLGSGLFDWPQAAGAGIPVLLASDVGGGTSLSMRRTMGDGYKVQSLGGHRVTAWDLLHAATRGPATALGWGGELGTLDAGMVADLCVWDWARSPVAQRRQDVAHDLHDKLFAWITFADEADLVQTWIAGMTRYERAGFEAGSTPCIDSN